MAFGQSPQHRYEIAVYVAGPMSGKRCADPERIYGDRAKETDDLVWYEGTEDELRARAELIRLGYFKSHAKAILDYLG